MGRFQQFYRELSPQAEMLEYPIWWPGYNKTMPAVNRLFPQLSLELYLTKQLLHYSLTLDLQKISVPNGLSD